MKKLKNRKIAWIFICIILMGFNYPSIPKHGGSRIAVLGSAKSPRSEKLELRSPAYRGDQNDSTSNRQPQVDPKTLFFHHTFVDFSKGKFSDSGGNLYVSRNGNIQFINVFDLNSDGYPEVVVNNDHNHYDTPDVLVYKNLKPYGLRSITPPIPLDAPAFQNFNWILESSSSVIRLPTGGGGRSILEDLNGDGYKDLIITNFIHGWTLSNFPSYIYWGAADGLNPTRRSLLPADRGRAIAVADLSGDGLMDIIVANPGREDVSVEAANLPHDRLTTLAGEREQSSYIFQQTEAGFSNDSVQVIPTLFAVDVKVADIAANGEKSLIFLEMGMPGAIRIIRLKNGKLGAPELLPVLAPKPLLQGKFYNRSILVKDLNQDGYPDIFVPSQGAHSEIFWNDNGEFSLNNRTVLDTENATAADAGDLNKDGFTDLVIANYFSEDVNGNVKFETESFIWWGSKEGFDKKNKTGLPTIGATSVRLEDINNSGDLDILFAQHRNQTTFDVPSYIYMNSSNGFYPENRSELQGFGAIDILAADNGTDSKDVILINTISGTVTNRPPLYIFKGSASRVYNPASVIRMPPSAPETNIAFADMEDKGKTDLIYLQERANKLVIRYNVYDEVNAHNLVEIQLPFNANTVNVADYNKDGILDVLATPLNGDQAALLFGRGNRKYVVKLFNFNYPAYSCFIADVNNDGILDAVTSGDKIIAILYGSIDRGNFYFQEPVIIDTHVFTPRVTIADFDNDGWVDIWCQNYHNSDTKSNDIDSWILINNNGLFSLDNKRSFKTFGAQGGSIAQLNDDKLELIIANYHAELSRRVGTFILSANKDGFLDESTKFRFPSSSSSANYVLDFDGNGYQDILVFNHSGTNMYNSGLVPTGGMHGIGSELFWGEKNGFNLNNKTWIPSFGPHARIMADPGSISRRHPFEVYTSTLLTNNTKSETFKLTITGQFNRKQYCSAEIIMWDRNSTDEISKASLNQILQSETEITYMVTIPKGREFQYRLMLNSSFSGAGPIVSSVKMDEMH